MITFGRISFWILKSIWYIGDFISVFLVQWQTLATSRREYRLRTAFVRWQEYTKEEKMYVGLISSFWLSFICILGSGSITFLAIFYDGVTKFSYSVHYISSGIWTLLPVFLRVWCVFCLSCPVSQIISPTCIFPFI